MKKLQSLLNFSDLQALTGNTSDTGFTGQSATETLVFNATSKTRVIIFNCTVKAYVYGVTNYGAWTSTSGESSIFAYNDETTIMANDDSNVTKQLLNSQMETGSYATVKYSLTGDFANGTYQHQSIELSSVDIDNGTINLNSMNYQNYVYNIDGIITETKLPTFKTDSLYKLNFFYYNSNGELLGIFTVKLDA